MLEAEVGFITGMDAMCVCVHTCVCHAYVYVYQETAIEMLPGDTAVRLLKILTGIGLIYLQQGHFGSILAALTHARRWASKGVCLKIPFVTLL